jgi:hypothetical protein
MKTKAPVSTEKYIAFNIHLIRDVFVILFFLLIASFGLWIEESFFTVSGVLLTVGYLALLFILPTYYVFSEEKLVICHPFKRREVIFWEDIRSISRYGSWSNPKFMGLPHYKIYYRHEKEVLFLNGEICRSRKTKRLLQKYYKGNVE